MHRKDGCPNPKDLAASDKAPLDLLPPVALHQLARALQHGAGKYGRFNWRATGVRPEVYYAAALRHLLAWASGLDRDQESGRHHLAHVMACCAVVLDAEACGRLEPWQTRLTDHRQPLEVEEILR